MTERNAPLAARLTSPRPDTLLSLGVAPVRSTSPVSPGALARRPTSSELDPEGPAPSEDGDRTRRDWLALAGPDVENGRSLAGSNLMVDNIFRRVASLVGRVEANPATGTRPLD